MVPLENQSQHVESKNFYKSYFKFKRLILIIIFNRILCTAEDYDSKKWACDGLAYLTLDADIKETLTEDKNSLHILYDLTKVCILIKYKNFEKIY